MSCGVGGRKGANVEPSPQIPDQAWGGSANLQVAPEESDGGLNPAPVKEYNRIGASR